jgi:iron(III)-salmochelin esterase
VSPRFASEAAEAWSRPASAPASGSWSSLLVWLAALFGVVWACTRLFSGASVEFRDGHLADPRVAAGRPTAAHSPRRARTARKTHELRWSFAEGPFGPTDVVISVPERAERSERFPVLIALHGRGESLKGRRRAARGWLDDYQLGRAISRLQAPPLRAGDFEQFVAADRLAQLNAGLTEHPYAGLIVVCPSLPDVFKGESAFEETAQLAHFLVDVLLPRVYAKTPALGTPESTGIDGVSLGGRAALFVGLNRPRAFGSVAGVQAALGASELERISDWAVQARIQNPLLVLRLLTSDNDYYLDGNERLSALLAQKGVPHQLTRVVGTHGYRFNRGPGSLEMLLFHNRVLRGWPAP